jgi:hypothetical protein
MLKRLSFFSRIFFAVFANRFGLMSLAGFGRCRDLPKAD